MQISNRYHDDIIVILYESRSQTRVLSVQFVLIICKLNIQTDIVCGMQQVSTFIWGMRCTFLELKRKSWRNVCEIVLKTSYFLSSTDFERMFL